MMIGEDVRKFLSMTPALKVDGNGQNKSQGSKEGSKEVCKPLVGESITPPYIISMSLGYSKLK